MGQGVPGGGVPGKAATTVTSENDQIDDYLEQIDQVFGVEELLGQQTDEQAVIDYFQQSFLGYSLFHSPLGSVHLSVSQDGKFRRAGCLYQPRAVAARIERLRPESVLELGAGRGYNLVYLARRFPGVALTGIDVTPRHLAMARLRTLLRRNVRLKKVSFDDYPLGEEAYGIIFDVESICYSSDLPALLGRVARALTPDGLFLSFNGLRGAELAALPPPWQTAVRLVETGMAVAGFPTEDDWTAWARHSGLRHIRRVDLSKEVLPNFHRFGRLAKRFFRHRRLRRLLRTALPRRLLHNAVVGLLAVETFQRGYHRYLMLECGKRG